MRLYLKKYTSARDQGKFRRPIRGTVCRVAAIGLRAARVGCRASRLIRAAAGSRFGHDVAATARAGHIGTLRRVRGTAAGVHRYCPPAVAKLKTPKFKRITMSPLLRVSPGVKERISRRSRARLVRGVATSSGLYFSLGVKLAVDQLRHEMRRHDLEVIVRGAAPCWIGHGPLDIAGHVAASDVRRRL